MSILCRFYHAVRVYCFSSMDCGLKIKFIIIIIYKDGLLPRSEYMDFGCGPGSGW